MKLEKKKVELSMKELEEPAIELEEKKEPRNISQVLPLMPLTSVSPYYDKTLFLWDKVNEIIRSINDGN